jgi:hypothetical protein
MSTALTARILTTLAAATLTASASLAGVTTWTLDSASLQTASDIDGYFWRDYDSISPTVFATPVTEGLHIVGGASDSDDRTVFSIPAADFLTLPGAPNNYRGSRLFLSGQGTIDPTGWDPLNDIIRTTFGFGFAFNSGELFLPEISTSYFLSNPQGDFIAGVGSGFGFDEPFLPNGFGLGFAFEDRFGNDISAATLIYWNIAINFDWTNADPSDTLTFTIPDNSIDINHITVPTPTAAALLTLSALTATRRRR